MIALARPPRLWHAEAMTNRTPIAGGFFLIVPIVIGFGWGLMTDHAMQGALIGFVIGLALALILWLVERRRG